MQEVFLPGKGYSCPIFVPFSKHLKKEPAVSFLPRHCRKKIRTVLERGFKFFLTAPGTNLFVISR